MKGENKINLSKRK